MNLSCIRWPVVLAAMAAASVASNANAAVFVFTYHSAVGTFAGSFEGTEQPDGRVTVTAGIGSPTLNGIAGPATPLATTAFTLFSGLPSTPVVTFDGSFMALALCSNASCEEGLVFDQVVYAQPIFGASPGFGEHAELFNAQQWSLARAVPEPASWAMMIAGFGLLGAALRRTGRAQLRFA